MPKTESKMSFEAELLRPAKPGRGAPWVFVLLPKNVSRALPRRGRTSVGGAINGHPFQATLEPDGQLSHWLKVTKSLQDSADAVVGERVKVEISPLAKELEPDIPKDLKKALAVSQKARKVWDSTTTIARVDWIHWITSAKQLKMREKRIGDACEMLASGKKRVCCFDQSGFYSKALSAPDIAK